MIDKTDSFSLTPSKNDYSKRIERAGRIIDTIYDAPKSIKSDTAIQPAFSNTHIQKSSSIGTDDI